MELLKLQVSRNQLLEFTGAIHRFDAVEKSNGLALSLRIQTIQGKKMMMAKSTGAVGVFDRNGLLAYRFRIKPPQRKGTYYVTLNFSNKEFPLASFKIEK